MHTPSMAHPHSKTAMIIYAKYIKSFFFLLCTSAMPLKKCSWPNLVAPSLSAIIPASTHTAFNCAPLNSSVLLASSS